ncbi:MAG: ribosome assembly cofactor RimP [Crocinitomicaceae bacterium]|nr:ribosome assembly cofactor RimP [Crocinitomicaceae bacterium]
MISKKKIIKLAEERINELNNGNYLVAVDISSKNAIKVKMDNINQGVSVKDCVSVSRNIEHNLDREKEDFELQVTSPGLDQPFVVINQYLKNLGNKVTVTTTSNAVLIGELLEANKKEITLKEIKIKKNTATKKKETIEDIHQIMMSEIKETKLIISF